MKKMLLTISVAMALTLSSVAMAGDMKLSASLGGQLGMPMGDFGDIWKMGMGGNGRIGLEISPAFEVGGTFSYSSFGLDEDGLQGFGTLGLLKVGAEALGGTVTATWGDMTVLEILVDARYFIPVGAEDAPFKPYLTGTVGMASVSLDQLDVLLALPGLADTTLTWPSGSETAAGFGIGAGFEYMFSPKVGFWLDGKYMLTGLTIAILEIPGINVDSRVDVAYFPIRAGVKIMFGGGE